MVHHVVVPAAKDVVVAWSGLSREELTGQVDRLVKDRGARAREVWAAVRDDTVLAAQVRGVLAGLRSEAKGTRDEAMRLVWINQAQQALAKPEPVAAPVVPVAEDPQPEPDDDIVLTLPTPAPPRTAAPIPAVVFQPPS